MLSKEVYRQCLFGSLACAFLSNCLTWTEEFDWEARVESLRHLEQFGRLFFSDCVVNHIKIDSLAARVLPVGLRISLLVDLHSLAFLFITVEPVVSSVDLLCSFVRGSVFDDIIEDGVTSGEIWRPNQSISSLLISGVFVR